MCSEVVLLAPSQLLRPGGRLHMESETISDLTGESRWKNRACHTGPGSDLRFEDPNIASDITPLKARSHSLCQCPGSVCIHTTSASVQDLYVTLVPLIVDTYSLFGWALYFALNDIFLHNAPSPGHPQQEYDNLHFTGKETEAFLNSANS